MEKRIEIEQHGAKLAENYRRKIAAGMNSEDAKRAFLQEMGQIMLANGYINIQEMQQAQSQMQPAGE